MISTQKPFTDLAKNLNKVNIDERLVPYFFAMLEKLQAYFEKKGCLDANNYVGLIEKYWLGENPFCIKIAPLEKSSGIYSRNKREIVVGQTVFEKFGEQVEEVLCHEFFHFLIATEPAHIKQADGTYKQLDEYSYSFCHNHFVDEGYTEWLTQQIYPQSNSYIPHVQMVKFVNFLLGDKDNVFSVLRGQLPLVQFAHSDLSSFLFLANAYHILEDNKKSMLTASQNTYYLDAQTHLVSYFLNDMENKIKTFEFDTLDEFCARVAEFDNMVPVQNQQTKMVVKTLVDLFVDTYFEKDARKEARLMIEEYLPLYRVVKTQLLSTSQFQTPKYTLHFNFYNHEAMVHFSTPSLPNALKPLVVKQDDQADWVRRSDRENFSISSKIFSNYVLENIIFDDENPQRQNIVLSSNFWKQNLQKQEKQTRKMAIKITKKMNHQMSPFAQIFKKEPQVNLLTEHVLQGKHGFKFHTTINQKNEHKLWIEKNGKMVSVDFSSGQTKLCFANGKTIFVTATDQHFVHAFDKNHQPLCLVSTMQYEASEQVRVERRMSQIAKPKMQEMQK